MNFKKWLENSMSALSTNNDELGDDPQNSVDLDTIRDPSTGRPVKMKSKIADNLFVHRIKKQKKKP
tara:strand:+ start:27196 stop:27393 length:198 start_codon:yes stop_codon:yes gene_type:complete